MAINISWGKPQQTKTIPSGSIDWGTPESRTQIATSAQQRYFPTKSKSVTQAVSNIARTAVDTVKSTPVANKSFKSAFLTDEVAKRAFTTWADTLKDTASRFNKAYDTILGPSKGVEKLAAGASAGLGVVNAAFAPIPAALQGLSVVPGVGHVADGVNQLFGAIMGGSGEAAVEILKQIPLSDETKKTLEPVVRETGALVGGVIAGKASTVASGRLKANTNTILDTVSRSTPKGDIPFIPIPGRNIPFIPIPGRNIPFIPIPGRNIPVIPIPKEAIKWDPVPQKALQTEVAPITVNTKAGLEGDIAVAKSVAKPASDYTSFESQTSLKLQQRAEKMGIEFTPDTPVQQRMNMVELATKSDEFLRSNPARARDVLAEKSEAPAGLNRESVYKAFERKALADRDPELLTELSRMTVGTEAARGLKALDDGVRLDANPMDAIREVRQARLQAATTRQKGLEVVKEVAKVKKATGKIPAPTKDVWTEFIKTIQC